ncbi:MAG: hypothetical protein ABSB50_13290 [Terracidiphilus sp.]
MKRTITSALLLLTFSILVAQNSPLPRYKVLNGYPRLEAITAINQAADQGYRILLTSRFVVMRLDATPPDTWRYMPSPQPTGTNAFLNALDQQGALGYGWLADTEFLEKQPHPRNYEYRLLEGVTVKSRAHSLESLEQDGFTRVGMTRRDVRLVYMHEIGSPPPEHPRHTRELDALRAHNLMKNISELAAQGYRYRTSEISYEGGRAVSMEECDASCGGPFEYRSFDVKNSEQLEHDLNALGKEGFRVLPKSLDWPPGLVERPLKHSGVFSYCVGDASSEASVQQFIDDCDRDGFAPINFAAHVGWIVGGFFIIAEKAEVSPAP